MANDVTFRRINGRIVPIRKNPKQPVISKPKKRAEIKGTEVAKGIGQIAVGTAAGFYSGKFAANTLRIAANYENYARSAFKAANTLRQRIVKSSNSVPYEKLELFSRQATNKSASAFRAAAESTRAFKLHRGARIFGTALAGGLIASGVRKTVKEVTGKEPNIATDVVSTAAGIAGGVATNAGFYKKLMGGKGFGIRGLGMAIRKISL